MWRHCRQNRPIQNIFQALIVWNSVEELQRRTDSYGQKFYVSPRNQNTTIFKDWPYGASIIMALLCYWIDQYTSGDGGYTRRLNLAEIQRLHYL
ncbi:hypothetical protein AVEN_167568-1 [Araneus ventricosus]|uniref:Uncharacterized protein n=1 Tax=Araneus ventricosus TaxID=182803 RepID=A0A4Y2S4N9_ARAVE|nr:hypothetical protein AVEN_28248-1 [Araneus ventricosus]GBN83181.1 hypothetical protein AVEN_167568-1 [Araneus ventricosus]